jgi:hypothetical protein
MSSLVTIALIVIVGVLVLRVLRDRAARKQRNLFSSWPIRAVSLADFDERFRPGEFGPSLDTQVQFVGRGVLEVPGGTSDTEAWVLSVLSKRADLMFEFGTCTGKTAYLWAVNSPPTARVVTLTLAPEGRETYKTDAGDDARDTAAALSESAFTRFLYTGTPAAGKVEQLFADSKSVDVERWREQCDLVFVDGSHAYSYVLSDSEKALRLVRPGGIVLWHDYLGPKHSPGVYRALNELARRLPLVRLQGTSFVAYRKPAS